MIDELFLTNIEINLLLEAIYLRYGTDFRNYTKSHIKRRIIRRMQLSNYNRISDLTADVLHNEDIFKIIKNDFSINTTEMFRYPRFYKTLKEIVKDKFLNNEELIIWHAGCSTGEEVLSVAILLDELNILDNAKIYATDFNENVINFAKDGIYDSHLMKTWTKNYLDAGGEKEFIDYYRAKYDQVIFIPKLLNKIDYRVHNLALDDKFIEADMVIVRNTLIYFDQILQNRVISLIEKSLKSSGLLGLGAKESLKYSDYDDKFLLLDERTKIYEKL